MKVQRENAENQGGEPCSKRGMQDVFLYAQKPFYLALRGQPTFPLGYK